MNERRAKIHIVHELPKTRRCCLMWPRGGVLPTRVSAQDMALMRLIDEIQCSTRSTAAGGSSWRIACPRKRVLMDRWTRRRYPRRRTSQGKGHRYPYLRQHVVKRAQVRVVPARWPGFMYLVAIIDWPLVAGVEHGYENGRGPPCSAKPEISNTDQGSSSPPRRSPRATRAWRSAGRQGPLGRQRAPVMTQCEVRRPVPATYETPAAAARGIGKVL